jgi:DNA-binding response OmpR family regulator
MIPDGPPVFHPRYSHRILYAGNDLSLLTFLQEILEDCYMVRCPNGSHARLFIEKIKYSLLLFDERLQDTTGAELESFTRTLPHRERTPIIIYKPLVGFDVLAKAIIRELSKG